MWEDEQIRQAARDNRGRGLVDRDKRAFANRLKGVADRLGRSYAAIRKRAERIGAWSYLK